MASYSFSLFCDPSTGQTFPSECSLITGGAGNAIGAGVPLACSSSFSAIGGGASNCIDATGVVGTNYAVVGGGQNNLVCAGTNHSSIFSGFNNCVASSCASILGGTGNSIPAGFANAHIAGSGIALGPGVGNPNSLHVNGLWANGIPGPGYALGVSNTVYFDTVPSLPVPYNACKFLMIF
jgi:hypothetical protein